MSKKVLVIGGTGMLGLPVARKLKEDGFQVTILSSDPLQASVRFGDEFTIEGGDVTDPESLKSPMDGQDFVYLNLSARLDPELYRRIEIEGAANAARIAREIGIDRIGMISGASSKGEGNGILFLDAKVRAERAIMDSGVPFTIMRPSWFFESLPMFVQGNRASVLGKQPVKRAWLAASDYARQVSNAFQTEEAVNKCFYNYGPVKMAMLDALQKFCGRHYPEIKPRTVSFGMARLVSLLPGQQMLKKVIPFFEYFETIPEDMDPSEADQLLGPNLTTIEEWMDSYQRPE